MTRTNWYRHTAFATGIALVALSGATAQVTRTPAPKLQAKPVSPSIVAHAPAAAPLTLAQLKAKIGPSLKIVSGPKIKNAAALTSPRLTALKSQKQAGDAEAIQILSSPGNVPQTTTPAPSASASRGVRLSANLPVTQAAPVSNTSRLASETKLNGVCMSTGIATVNKQATGVVFTPDPNYNLYTIRGCGFGSTPGKIYLTGTFPAHQGRINLLPTSPSAWSNQAIIAKVDPKVTGELDQDNVGLVVESASGPSAHASGFSFYALRGQPILLQSIPRGQMRLNPEGSPNSLSPDAGTFGQQMTISVYRSALGSHDYSNPVHQPDDIRLNLKPGFVVDSSQSVYLQSVGGTGSANTNNLQLDDRSNVINGTEIQPRWYIAAIIPTEPSWAPYHQELWTFYALYGLNIWVVGPAGITDPFAQ